MQTVVLLISLTIHVSYTVLSHWVHTAKGSIEVYLTYSMEYTLHTYIQIHRVLIYIKGLINC